MPGIRAVRRALIPLLLIATAGCAWFDRSVPVDVQPVQSAQSAVSPDDLLYNAAVRAISVRDYGAALDYLQAARRKTPEDIRVLNAFGVVYDKLGRFDLSARYYAQAEKLDPKSTIVAANLMYSERLQERARSGIPSEIALAPVAPPAPDTGAMAMEPFEIQANSTPATVAAAVTEPRVFLGWTAPPVYPVTASNDGGPAPEFRSVARLAEVKPELFHPVATGTKKPLLTGHPLVIINASGRRGASEPVRQRLASRGWTAPRSSMSDGPQQTATTIRFASVNSTAAHALARTLPFSSHLVTCRNECAGLRLVLGREFLKPRAGKPASAGLKRS